MLLRALKSPQKFRTPSSANFLGSFHNWGLKSKSYYEIWTFWSINSNQIIQFHSWCFSSTISSIFYSLYSFSKVLLHSCIRNSKKMLRHDPREKKVTARRLYRPGDVQGEKLGHTKDWIEVLLTRWWGSFDRWRANHFWKKKELVDLAIHQSFSVMIDFQCNEACQNDHAYSLAQTIISQLFFKTFTFKNYHHFLGFLITRVEITTKVSNSQLR